MKIIDCIKSRRSISLFLDKAASKGPGIYDPDSKFIFNEIREVDAENIVKLNQIIGEHDIKFFSYFDFISEKK